MGVVLCLFYRTENLYLCLICRTEGRTCCVYRKICPLINLQKRETNMKKENIYRGTFYLTGMIVLAFGIIMNTKSGLGVSPIISVAYSVSEILHLNFGNMTLIWYSIFILVEIIIHCLTGKKGRVPADILQFPVSLIVTRFMNLFSSLVPTFATDCAGTFWGTIPGRILVLLLAIILTGIGAAVSLNMRVVPNPGDGIVQAIADVIHLSVGTTKNIFDISCVGITCILCLIGIGHIIGIGIGTVLAMIGVGRVIAVFNHLFKKRMAEIAGIVD